ncbi:MAG: hypothetical protein NVSMB5_16710 [Candidatus Velthaea sp.]
MNVGIDRVQFAGEYNVFFDDANVLQSDEGDESDGDANDTDSANESEQSSQLLHVEPIRRNFA